jgi:hypothetical protein
MGLKNVRFVLEIDSGNDALVSKPAEEIYSILRFGVGPKLKRGDTSGNMTDSNGNRVGSWKLILESEESTADSCPDCGRDYSAEPLKAGERCICAEESES